VQLPRPRAVAAAQATAGHTAGARASVLDAGQWRTVEAICARIIPSDRDPGAREAGCVNFIDKALAHEDEAWRPIYRAGLAGVERFAKVRFQKSFVELEPGQQDEILGALERDAARPWPAGEVTSSAFFETIRVHTIWGFLADPRYGGNRDYLGWKLVGYPGPRHAGGGYSPKQQLGREPIEPVWGGRLDSRRGSGEG
jgi:gluconate 2-dehydrogenase gamma chain